MIARRAEVFRGDWTADDALHGEFLFFHQNVVAKRIGTVPGTAGGGVPYLDFSRESLGWFPALALFRETG